MAHSVSRVVSPRPAALPRVGRSALRFWAIVALIGAAWVIAWSNLDRAVSGLVDAVPGLPAGSPAGDALCFFGADLGEVVLLLGGVVTLVSFVRSYFPPERVRGALLGRGEVAATFGAAGLGMLTPFCSCSAVPLFIGFVEAGVPLGVAFAFLVAAPMVNEVALALLLGLFGLRIALLYCAAGLAVAVGAGFAIGRLHAERFIEPDVLAVREPATLALRRPSAEERLVEAWGTALDMLRRLWAWLVVGIAAGAIVQGIVPADLVLRLGGRGDPLAVPGAVLLGIPMYSQAAGLLPLLQALVAKGLPLGTTLAFTMAVTAISAPEFIILRRVMRRPLLVAFAATVTLGILAVGYLFNVVA